MFDIFKKKCKHNYVIGAKENGICPTIGTFCTKCGDVQVEGHYKEIHPHIKAATMIARDKHRREQVDVIELGAEIAHDIWAHWMRYFLQNKDSFTKEDFDRWYLQSKTPYSELTEKEKQSDRDVAKQYFDREED